MSRYIVIYDGQCNLCSNLVQRLEARDQGQTFQYLPMQDHVGLQFYGIEPQDCEGGMILIDEQDRAHHWQGSAAAEEIARLEEEVRPWVAIYRRMPGFKWLGDRLYEQIRDHRYTLFGRRSQLYQSSYPAKLDGIVEPVSKDADTCKTNCKL
ncbi:MAG: DCC1-like thiol-disulfide oxidoreductase family protein [Synechococcales bacterium]|nr:DCC1-like thiol-disulfide oxidoreductase family protein [Synechococcales bacterium]